MSCIICARRDETSKRYKRQTRSLDARTGKDASNSNAQSAMEYLMTYGWAILIVAVVLGALFQLGVFTGSSLAPKAQPGSCKVLRPNGSGTTMFINLAGVCTGQLPQFVAQFNGASSYINVGNGVSNVISTYTVEAWVKYTSVSNFMGIVSKNGPTEVNNGWQLTTHTNKFRWVNWGSVSDLRSTTSPSPGVWYQVVGVQEGTGVGQLKLYVNGVLEATGNGGAITTTANVVIGREYAGVDNYYFNGQIANVQIYNTSLAQAEIQGLYAGGIGGAPTRLQNLVGWWPLNGDANDYSGNGNNGANSGATFTSTWTK